MPQPIPVQIDCTLQRELEKTASGTGLAFIAFTEAISQFGVTAPFFAVLFFLMLLTLGLGSMIGTLEGEPDSAFFFASICYYIVAEETTTASLLYTYTYAKYSRIPQ